MDGETILDWARPGRVLTAFCDDVDVARLELRVIAEEQLVLPTLVALEWTSAPSLVRELDEMRDALAAAAKDLWPNWYVTAERRIAQGGTKNAGLDSVIAHLPRISPGASDHWVRVAWQRCQEGTLPLVNGMASAEQVRQLAMALDPSRLVFALSVTSADASSARVQGLARAAEWLSRESHAKTLLLVPSAWQGRGELDHVNYDAVGWPKEDAPGLPQTDPEFDGGKPCLETSPEQVDRTKVAVNVGPIVGKPHPASEAEKALFARLCEDTELASLFEPNQPIDRFGGGTPYIVDLVWRAGGLVVEIDGPEHHRPHACVKDKERDYRLFMGGYSTLRLINDEVYRDESQALEKIRNVVRRLREQRKGHARK